MTETICLLCGVLCDDEVWRGQLPRLRELGEVRVFSFRRFDTLPAMARHVLAEVDGPLAVVGHSMGGRVALEMFRLAPARIGRVALLDTGFEPPGPEEAARRGAMVARAEVEGIAAIAEAWARPMVGVSNQDDAELLERLVGMVCRMSAQTYAAQTRALLTRPDAADVLAAIDCPTLVMCGEEDLWSPPERHRRMTERIAGARLALVPGCGHMAPMERPEDVQAQLEAWLMTSVADRPAGNSRLPSG